MKNSLFAIFFMLFCFSTNAQTVFSQRLKQNVAKLNQAKTFADLENVYNEFTTLTRASDSEKWKAFYYAGLTQFRKAEFLLKSGKASEALDANSIAIKYSAAIPNDDPLVKELLRNCEDQRKTILKIIP